MIGINNRDLHTFVTDIAVTERLLADYAGDALIVTESGIDSPDDIRRLDAAGARAFLIGESLLRGGRAGCKTRGVDASVMTVRVKICGITRVEDARAAIDAGADMIGLNFYARRRATSTSIERARNSRGGRFARHGGRSIRKRRARLYR